jgi:phosphoribosylpyrophosphate synthetase
VLSDDWHRAVDSHVAIADVRGNACHPADDMLSTHSTVTVRAIQAPPNNDAGSLTSVADHGGVGPRAAPLSGQTKALS